MNEATSPGSSHVAVLIADDDDFESGYLAAVLVARGVQVVGPTTEVDRALAAIDVPGHPVAVIAQLGDPTARSHLGIQLRKRGVPFLTLVGVAAPSGSPEEPVLTRPFAAYQVADWMVDALA